MNLSIVIASSTNGCIGKDNTLPWSLPKDMKRFKEITTTQNSILIMGRKTYESIGKPLPGRTSIVLSSNKSYAPHKDIIVVSCIEEALAYVREIEDVHEENYAAFIIGGSGLFKEVIDKDIIDTIHHTLVDAEIEGDTFIDIPDWKVENEVEVPIDEKHQYKMFFRTLSKI
jgi:dihydrofolate reductase